MAHKASEDPRLEAITQIALSLPETTREVINHHGIFRVRKKAFAYFRTGVNTYASISGGWMSEVYSILGVSSSNFWLNTGESAFFDLMQARLSQFKAVTLATSTRPSMLVGNHAYTLVNVWKDDSGATHYVVRNPWGVSGTRAENSGGYATLTFAQMQANFVCGTFAA